MRSRRPTRPIRYKVYAPDGKAETVIGLLHMYYNSPPLERCRIAFTNLRGQTVLLNGLCLVVNEEDGSVAYHPRRPPRLPPFADQGLKLMEAAQEEWLKRHPDWPRELADDVDFDKPLGDGAGWLDLSSEMGDDDIYGGGIDV